MEQKNSINYQQKPKLTGKEMRKATFNKTFYRYSVVKKKKKRFFVSYISPITFHRSKLSYENENKILAATTFPRLYFKNMNK